MSLAAPDTREFLRNIPIFGGLEDPKLESVIGLLEEKEFAEGSVVVGQGDTSRNMYVVAEGEMVIRRAGPSGHLRKVVRLKRGEFFGETTLIEIHPSDASIIADRPARLYSLTNRGLYSLYQRDPSAYLIVVMNIARELSRRLRKAENRICELAEQTEEDDRTQIGR